MMGLRSTSGCRLTANRRTRTLNVVVRTFFPQFSPVKTHRHHRERRVVPFSQEQLFAVVSDVDNYKKFVPFCVNSRVLRMLNDNAMEAELEVGFKLFAEKYTSRVRLIKPEVVSVCAVDSRLFKSLVSTWKFLPGQTPSSTTIDFSVEFEVKSAIAAHAMDSFFEEVALQQVKAFERRCHYLYGPHRQRRPRTCKPEAPGKQEPLFLSALAKAGVERHVKTVRDVFAEHAGDGGSLLLEDFKKACKDLARMHAEFKGFKLLAEDPSMASAVYSSIKYLSRKRLRRGLHSHEGVPVPANLPQGSKPARINDNAQGGARGGGVSRPKAVDGAAVGERAGNPARPGALKGEGAIKGTGKGGGARGVLWSVHHVSRGVPPEGLADFAVSVYMMVEASLEDRAKYVFSLMDTDGNSKVDRAELQTALQLYMKSMARVVPMVVTHHLQGTEALADSQRIKERVVEVVDELMDEIIKDIPRAVDQIFEEVDAEGSGSIAESEWDNAWQNFPELLDMMSIRGLGKTSHWAAIVQEQVFREQEEEEEASIRSSRGGVS